MSAYEERFPRSGSARVSRADQRSNEARLGILDSSMRAARVLRFGTQILVERSTGFCPTDPDQVPASAAEMAPEWLDKVLCGKTPGAKVTDIKVVGGSDGTNIRRALHITYNDVGAAASLPTSLFAKSGNAMRTRVMNVVNTRSESEVRFYNDVRVKLPIEAPTALYAGFDKPSGRMLIIFPNMVEQGVTFLDPTHDIDRRKAEGMVDLIATYQAVTWNSSDLLPSSWLKTTFQYQQLCNICMPFQQCGEAGIDRAVSVLPAELLQQRQKLWPLHMASIKRLERAPRVLTHYDMHVGNWYYTHEGRMGLTDWSMRLGHWSSDLAYALISALKIEDRRAWEQDLIERYRQKLAELGIPDPPSQAEAWDEYRRQAFHPFFFWTTTIGATALQPDMQPASISLANLERMGQAIVDLDSIRLMEDVA